MNDQAVMDIFERMEAVWFHNGDTSMPHAKLTSGKCSNAFFDCRKVLAIPWFCEQMAKALYRRMIREHSLMTIDLTVGSAYSAITFSYEFSKLVNSRHGFTEKDPVDPQGKKMIWKGETITRPTTVVLQIEELITEQNTLHEVRRAMNAQSQVPINFLPIVGCIVHRPPKLSGITTGVKIISLIEREVWAVNSIDCPLCKSRSKPLRPRGNWIELTQKK